MQLVPWRRVADWKCDACGVCCKTYRVVLNFQDWLRIVKDYGFGNTVLGLDFELSLKRRSDGSCVFLKKLSSMQVCGLQHMKPKACKLWPFKVLSTAKFGYENDAAYLYGKDKFFVYLDSACSGLRYGQPTWEFANDTIKEFIAVKLGLVKEQHKTTADLASLKQ